MKMEDPCLDQQALVSFVKSLYFDPRATTMPLEIGEVAYFSELEVQNHLNQMQKGKATDLQHFNVELLQWGGPSLVSALTICLNQVVQCGLPEDWTARRLVPIHKGGSKQEVNNYRIVLIASIFAKVLGGLLAARTSSWAKSHMKRAPSQAGFRPRCRHARHH